MARPVLLLKLTARDCSDAENFAFIFTECVNTLDKVDIVLRCMYVGCSSGDEIDHALDTQMVPKPT